MQSEYINTNLLSPSVETKIYSQYSTGSAQESTKSLVNSPSSYDYYNHQPKSAKLTKPSSEDSPRLTKVIPKNEALSSSSNNCCNMMPTTRQELLVPKSEDNNCRVNSPQPPPPTTTIRQGYDYMNQDSNSSSISSLETMNSRAIGSTIHHPSHHVLPMQPTVTYPMTMTVDDSRMTHQMSQRSPYESGTMMNDELYHHRTTEHGRAYMHPSGVARPVVTYSNDVTRGYENSVVSAANHRPYDPGTGSYDRYDSQACTTIQSQQQHLHSRNMYYLGQTGMTAEEQERAYHQEAVAVQQHQMAMAASAASMMKSEDGELVVFFLAILEEFIFLLM